MPDITAREIDGLTSLFSEISNSIALALSEQINVEATIDNPEIHEKAIKDLLLQSAEMFTTSFHCSASLTVESLFTLTEDAAVLLSNLASGGDGSGEIAAFEESMSAPLETAMSGVARGLATALSNTLGEVIEVEGCTSHFGPLTLPPVFAMSETALEIVLPLTIVGLLDTQLVLLITPDTMHSLLPASDENDETPILDESALTAMLNDISALSEDDSMSSAPVMPPAPGKQQQSPIGIPRGIDLILDIPLDVTVELGRVRMLIKDVLELTSGSIVELDRVAGEPVDLLVNGRLIAKGEVVVIEDNFGIRVTEILSPVDRVAGLSSKR